ncbi:MAG: ankyrin repeat domain-containing protein, partial [Terriglobales bacterium]
MRGFRQLVCVLLLLPSAAAGQSAPAIPQAGQQAVPAPRTAEEKKSLDGALLEAVEYDNRSEVQRLLAQGADPNARDEHGVTALMKSAEDMDAALARLLIAAGADVNARDAVGMTALLTAADDGSPEVLR